MKFKSLSLISYYLCVCSFFLRKADAFKYVEEEETQPTFRDWDTAYELAQLLVDNMSLEQKVNITTGIGWGNGPCVGNTGRTENPDFPELCLQDSPLGIRMAENITSGVSGINAAASFDKTAIYNRGKYLANEFRNKGINALLGPTINIMRTPQGGRNWEGFGEDPFLAGVASVETINGIQSQGVMAVAKHLIGNEQETNRYSSSSNIDDRTTHEVYLWPFIRSVEAGVVSVMCSYNKINGTYACENDHVINGLLKGELNFKGFIQSDWSAAHSTAKSAISGLDMMMPGDIDMDNGDNGTYFGLNLTRAVKNGQVSEERITNMVTRIIASWYKLGQDKGYPSTNINSFRPELDEYTDVQDNHKKLVREMGAASTVILRNINNALPLKPSRTKLAIIGEDAGPNRGGLNSCPNHGCNRGTLAQGWGSGTANFPYLIAPLDGIANRVDKSVQIDTLLDNYDLDSAQLKAKNADIAIVFANSNSGEAFITVDGNKGDRNNISLWNNGDNLISAVADSNKNTIVVIHSVGPVLMPWINHPNVTAIVWPGLPGQESGNSLADVLFGDVNPSGRLPYTIAKDINDYPAVISENLEIEYEEGINIGYRWFDLHEITPLFEFGFGLSYTRFFYSNPMISSSHFTTDSVNITVSVEVKNIGDYNGAEVTQAYISFPPIAEEPPKVLRGFEKNFIEKGKHRTIIFSFGEKELSYWSTTSSKWTVPRGKFEVLIGSSSRNIHATLPFYVD